MEDQSCRARPRHMPHGCTCNNLHASSGNSTAARDGAGGKAEGRVASCGYRRALACPQGSARAWTTEQDQPATTTQPRRCMHGPKQAGRGSARHRRVRRPCMAPRVNQCGSTPDTPATCTDGAAAMPVCCRRVTASRKPACPAVSAGTARRGLSSDRAGKHECRYASTEFNGLAVPFAHQPQVKFGTRSLSCRQEPPRH